MLRSVSLATPPAQQTSSLLPPPSWWRGHGEFTACLETNRQLVARLRAAYQDRLKVSFDAKQELAQDSTIQSLGAETQNNLLIAKSVYERFVLLAEEECRRNGDQCLRMIAFNAATWMKSQLNATLAHYHQHLETYMSRLQSQHVASLSKKPVVEISRMQRPDAALDTPSMLQEHVAQHANEARSAAIQQICRSVQEIHLLTAQLDTTIRANDAVLARIDRQVVKSYEHIDAGNRKLENAEGYSDSNGKLFLGCCGSMSVAIAILLIIVIWRHS
jgi:hypothetical protein